MPETPAEDVAPQQPIEGPDWSAVEFHPQCPLCEYDLFGLSAPRCPECGFTFEWRDVLDPRAAEHPYLFEYQSRRRIRSFVRTAWHAAAPRGFWFQLHPSLRPRVRRLIGYSCLGLFLHVVTLVAATFCELCVLYADFLGSAVFGSASEGPRLDWIIKSVNLAVSASASTREMYAQVVLRFAGLPALMVLLVFAALSAFRLSMKRARIKTAHVLRCVVYSFDPAGWAATCALVSFAFVVMIVAGIPELWDTRYSLIIAAVWILLSLYRLYRAYKYYLRFEHPLATIIAVAIVVTLIFAILLPDDVAMLMAFFLHGVWLY